MTCPVTLSAEAYANLCAAASMLQHVCEGAEQVPEVQFIDRLDSARTLLEAAVKLCEDEYLFPGLEGEKWLKLTKAWLAEVGEG